MPFRFRKFQVYQDAKRLHFEVVKHTRKFPREYYYLKDQLNRSSLSIVLQIAEGSAKRSDRDFNRYLEMGMGSGNETAAGLDVSLDQHLLTDDDYKGLMSLCESVVNQLGGLSKKLLVGG